MAQIKIADVTDPATNATRYQLADIVTCNRVAYEKITFVQFTVILDYQKTSGRSAKIARDDTLQNSYFASQSLEGAALAPNSRPDRRPTRDALIRE